MSSLRYLVAGTGAVGLFYGTRLLRAGCDVVFAAGSGGETLTRTGIRVVRPHGDVEDFEGVRVVEVPRGEGGVKWHFPRGEWWPDVVVVTLKSTGNAWLRDVVSSVGGGVPVVVTLQNGLGNEEWMEANLPTNGVGGGICFVCLHRLATGVVEHQAHGAVRLGWFSGVGEDVCERFRSDLAKGGVDTGDGLGRLREIRWRKLMWNVPFNGLSVVHDVSVDRLLGDSRWLGEVTGLMREVRAAALAEGCDVPVSYEDKLLADTAVAGAYLPSTYLDWKAGRLVELDAIWREAYRRGRSLGLAMPLLQRLINELEHRVIWRIEA
jgi:2-dehydropantoate 2-reductase